jgi:hypothetical protein
VIGDKTAMMAASSRIAMNLFISFLSLSLSLSLSPLCVSGRVAGDKETLSGQQPGHARQSLCETGVADPHIDSIIEAALSRKIKNAQMSCAS